MIPVEVFEGRRKAQEAALNPEALKTWLVQVLAQYDGRIVGITIHAHRPEDVYLGSTKGD